MVRFRALLSASALIVGGGSAFGADSGAPPSNPPCVSFSAYSIYGVGYDHVVKIENGCDTRAACRVSTDVNPEELRVSVPPKKQVEVVTFRGSPSRVFTAKVLCELEG